MSVNASKVWGIPRKIASGEVRRWQIGPLELFIENDGGVWNVGYRRDLDPLCDAFEEGLVERLPAELEMVRTAGRLDECEVTLLPLTADRSVVVRPETPTYIFPGQVAEFFVTTAIWVGVHIGEQRLIEIPSFRPSDTWFGEITGPGELSYASRTAASAAIERLSVRPARVATRITLRNSSGENLTIDRINLPAPYLSVFLADNQRLWTEDVEVDIAPEPKETRVNFRGGRPKDAAGKPKRLSDAREHRSGRGIGRALHLLMR